MRSWKAQIDVRYTNPYYFAIKDLVWHIEEYIKVFEAKHGIYFVQARSKYFVE